MEEELGWRIRDGKMKSDTSDHVACTEVVNAITPDGSSQVITDSMLAQSPPAEGFR